MTVCYLCGKEGADTSEHVVPRCLYVGSLPHDVITLPAHEGCNKFTSLDEEAFRNHIAAALPRTNQGSPLWDKTWKAIQRSEAQGMRTDFYREMLTLPELSADGRVLSRPVIARLRHERGNRVLAKIVRGLFYGQTGELLPNVGTLWRIEQLDRNREFDKVPLSRAFRIHDVLDVRWTRFTEDPAVSFWLLGFYEIHWFMIITASHAQPLAELEPPGQPIAWPDPQ